MCPYSLCIADGLGLIERTAANMENAPLLLLLILVIGIMGGYYYWKRAQRRDTTDVEPRSTDEPHSHP